MYLASSKKERKTGVTHSINRDKRKKGNTEKQIRSFAKRRKGGERPGGQEGGGKGENGLRRRKGEDAEEGRKQRIFNPFLISLTKIEREKSRITRKEGRRIISEQRRREGGKWSFTQGGRIGRREKSALLSFSGRGERQLLPKREKGGSLLVCKMEKDLECIICGKGRGEKTNAKACGRISTPPTGERKKERNNFCGKAKKSQRSSR